MYHFVGATPTCQYEYGPNPRFVHSDTYVVGTNCIDGSTPNLAKPLGQQCGGAEYWSTGIARDQIIEKSCPVGNPIYPGTSIKAQIEVDFQGAGLNALTLSRVYRSSYFSGPYDGFSQLWMHQWQRRLVVPFDKGNGARLFVIRADGAFKQFIATGGNTWTAADGNHDALKVALDNTNLISGWTYVEAATDTIESYDSTGKLLTVRERNGWTTTLTYSDTNTPAGVTPRTGLLINVKNQFNQILSFGYDAQARITSVTTPDGKVIQYSYDSAGVLASVTWPDGNSRHYHYEDTRFTTALTGITDEAGARFASYAYDEQGRAISSEHAGGADKVQVQYLSQSQSVVTSADGSNRTYTFDLQNNVLRPTNVSAPCVECGDVAKTSTYDTSGNLSSTVDFADKEIRYTYDALGRETQRIEGYGTAGAKTTTTEWHPTYNLPLRVASPNRVDGFTYDAKGQTTSYVTYATSDQNGSLGFGAIQLGQSTGLRWEYDANGLVIAAMDTIDNIESARWTYSYDTSGNLAILTNPQGQIGRALTYDSAGRLLTAIDTSGRQIEIRYNNRGNMTLYQRGTDTVVYGYNQAGFLTTVSGPGSFRYELEYDNAHRLVAYWLPAELTTQSLTSLSENPFGQAARSAISVPPTSENASWLTSMWNTIKGWFGWLFTNAHAQASPTQLIRIPVNPRNGQSGPGMAPMPVPADVLEPGNGEKHSPDTLLTRLGAELGSAGIRMVRHVSGTVIGAARLLSCDMSGGDDDDCERQRDQDEGNCQSTVKARYGSAGAAICMRSAMTRYAECLRFGTGGIRTPLSGFETPL
ncbi:DUF6531 domain-containing protein [Cupriavidus basilensis]|uniref:DUF6531 domain-containing protein n=1 Tax=Cupriavidus basilensis TaxID=68895 RepID=UPI0012E0447F|nr:DUF6531 domain-containing protein [Cupriavidus basilensis]